ncbi:hypothetical protein KZ287_33490, partial [Escherichia coli]|nr:hypothetical protein [Escherichia coli]
MILAANPGLNPNIIVPGQVILIPDLPDKTTIPYSIHVFIAERELELRENNVVKATYPIAVGQMLSTTPVGDFVIVNR